jgi:transposase, IS30 family
MINKGHKKLDVEDRMVIQACLHDHHSISQIAKRLDVNKSSVSRELSRNSEIGDGNAYKCPVLKKIIVCNVCKKKAYCINTKRFYDFAKADGLAENRKRVTRSHPKLPYSSIAHIDGAVSNGVSLGQSLHHIYAGDSRIKSLCCERTVRRLVYRGNLSVRPHQLRHYVTYKHVYVKSSKDLYVRDIRCLIGRTYKDFLRYRASHKRANFVEYDSVIGQKTDKKAILTITFPQFAFQFGLLVRKGNPVSVNSQLRNLFKRLGNSIVNAIFPINLCDNGIEFSIFHQLECDEHGEMIARCFFTNPYRATDKAHCERYHELVRYCLPKGKSLDFLTQDILDEMFSNINSYVRASKNNATPYDLVKARFGKAFLDAINIKRVPNKKVKLTQLA